MRNLIVFLILLIATSASAQVKSYQDKYVSVTPVVTASSAYTTKDNVGGLMTFSNITCQNMQKGQFIGVIIADKSDQAVEYNLVFFKSAPSQSDVSGGGDCTGATKYICDKNAFDPLDADLPLLMPFVNLQTTDRVSFADNGYSSLSSLDSVAMSGNTVTYLPGTIYMGAQVIGTPTYTETSALTFTLIYRCN